ncbi:cadmium resistance transporter [Companilactobacillus hulinensis]|uniref:cadmium resistance transporter n=1 Tax=Companilactobacillus hulinensis TaxID=2486007 RepID=UPI000F78AF2D|nr:cadmium resistance transporter [Companilactobacillus hulinensis]
MFNSILTGVTAYISTSIDYLIILMVIFGTTQKKQRWSVYLGDVLGTSVLVATSLILAFVLGLIPSDWMLGLLGIIPILMGLKLLFFGEKDDDDEVEKGMKKRSSVILNVALITIATCGADNIGIYVPIFVQSNFQQIITILITFFVMLTLFCYIGFVLGKIPQVANVLEHWGKYITAIVYIVIGIVVLIESGTIAHFI